MAAGWWFLIGVGVGLLLGGGAVYLLMYRWRALRRPGGSLPKRLEGSEPRMAPRRSESGEPLTLPTLSPLVGRRMAGDEAPAGAADESSSGQGAVKVERDRQDLRRMVESLQREMDFDEAPPPRRRAAAMERAESAGNEPLEEAAPPVEAEGRLDVNAPSAPTDLVHFSVTAPPSVLAGATFLLSVWAHLDAQRAEVIERARQELGEEPSVHTRGPTRVARGTRLAFHVEVEGMGVEEPVGWVDWEGEIAQASFFVDAPADAAPGNHKGRVSVFVEGLPVMEMRFLIRVGEAAAASAPLTTEIQRYRSAFASYSSKDRAEVFKRIQGIHQVAPDLDIFVDVDSLRSGQDWEQALWQQISSRDVFFLFWSANAKKSRWVEKEWRFAIEKRGLTFIDPIPLAPPDEAPPPPELSSKHFNDRELVFIKAYSGRH